MAVAIKIPFSEDMTPSQTNDWTKGLYPTAVQFLRSSAKEIALLVVNADNMTRFRSQLTEFADKWAEYRIAEQADREGNWQPSMGTPENPLAAIWPDLYVKQPSGPGIHVTLYPIHVRQRIGAYAFLEALHDHILLPPNCERIDDGRVPQELSDTIWQNIVTYVEGERRSKGYVNIGLINWAMREVAADLRNGADKQEKTLSETSGTGSLAVSGEQAPGSETGKSSDGPNEPLTIPDLVKWLKVLQSARDSEDKGRIAQARNDLKVHVGSVERMEDLLREFQSQCGPAASKNKHIEQAIQYAARIRTKEAPPGNCNWFWDWMARTDGVTHELERGSGAGKGEGQVSPPAKTNMDLPDEAMFSPKKLAELFDVPYEPLRKRLERLRKENDGSYVEDSNNKSTEPKYLYKIGFVRPIVKVMKASSKASSICPAPQESQ